MAGGVAGEDHGVEDVVVQAAEAEVGQRPEAGGAQVGQDVVVVGGEQSDQLAAPAADGGLGHVVTTCHVGLALVVAEYGQDDHRDLARRQDLPPEPNRFQVTPQ
ncbi:hypothetical protein RI578_39120 [Streptomyces sp. BB1-1-1]|uniref:hypothetical protein n=1 Tax=Streptomyces sp. BB1-1-1 TaxID=3074430 RepID=UPI002877C6F8|nr:hypothetical protein [Streptomyces sp. BB1-1-1]WND39930.1 hypothetical protein RI578_39120 [Streptomyces sp. BB1-1-1]